MSLFKKFRFYGSNLSFLIYASAGLVLWLIVWGFSAYKIKMIIYNNNIVLRIQGYITYNISADEQFDSNFHDLNIFLFKFAQPRPYFYCC